MSGETNLSVLLKTMNPIVDNKTYIFCSMKVIASEPLKTQAWAIIQEEEGTTLILSKDIADQYLIAYDSVFKKITLKVHSSLNAVGLTAKISTKLMKLGISANVVAGYYHDHIFVQQDKVDSALVGLKELANGIE